MSSGPEVANIAQRFGCSGLPRPAERAATEEKGQASCGAAARSGNASSVLEP